MKIYGLIVCMLLSFISSYSMEQKIAGQDEDMSEKSTEEISGESWYSAEELAEDDNSKMLLLLTKLELKTQAQEQRLQQCEQQLNKVEKRIQRLRKKKKKLKITEKDIPGIVGCWG